MLLWLLVFHFVGVDSPQKSRWISADERAYLVANLHTHDKRLHGKRPRTPWRAILTSVPLLACLFCNFAFGVYLTMVSLFMPSFFKEVLFLNMKEVSEM